VEFTSKIWAFSFYSIVFSYHELLDGRTYIGEIDLDYASVKWGVSEQFIDLKLDALYELGRAIVLRGRRWRAALT